LGLGEEPHDVEATGPGAARAILCDTTRIAPANSGLEFCVTDPARCGRDLRRKPDQPLDERRWDVPTAVGPLPRGCGASYRLAGRCW
jgi:hypothetical protein